MKHSEGFLKLVNDAKGRVREISVADTRARLAADQNVQLIDVREDNEWLAGHAAGAKHLGKGIIERDIETEVPDKVYRIDSLLWRRLPFGPRRRRFATDGLHKRLVNGRRLESLERVRRADSMISNRSRENPP